MTDNGRAPAARTEARPPAGGSPDGVASATVAASVKPWMPVGAFVTDDHRYYFNGDGPKPSVTTILEVLDKPALGTWKAQEAVKALYGLYRKGSEWTAEEANVLASPDEAVKWALAEVRRTRSNAASVGTGLHHIADMVTRASESDSEGFQVSDDVRPYLDAYSGFLERYKRSSFVSSEKAVWSLNGYGGTYDLLMMIGGELWLIDIKTGKGLYPEFALQLAAYRWADYIILPGNPQTFQMPNIERTGILHIRPDTYPDLGYRLLEYPTTYEQDYMTFLGILEAYKWKQEGRHKKPIIVQHAFPE